MSTIPSLALLAKDICGNAVELAGVENTRVTSRVNRVFFYNLALTELYNILVLINSDEYTSDTTDTATSAGDLPKHRTIDLAVSAFNALDKIIAVELVDKTEVESVDDLWYDDERVSIKDFLRHKKYITGAIDPYDETIIWTIINTKLHLLIGENLTVTVTDLTADVHFRRQPTLLTLATFDTAKIDTADKYMTLLVLRIASLIEYRVGISEKSMVAVKTAYEMLLSNVQTETRNKIMSSILTPIGVSHDVSGNN